VSTHLKNTLLRLPENIQFVVIGDNVEEFSSLYPLIKFHNVPLSRNFNLFLDIISCIKIAYLILKYKPKVVHSLMTKAGLYSAIISFILRVRVRVHTFTGQIWSTRSGISKYLLMLVDKVIISLNTNCFTDSKSQSQFLFDSGITIKGRLIPFILNGSISGVDIHKFNGENLEIDRKYILNKYDLNSEQFIIGYVARKSVDKGCIDMLKIFSEVLRKIPNIKIKLLFIGPDESDGLISDFYKVNNDICDKIIDIGFVNNHHQYLAACNLMCLPSYREGFGSIVIDAAAIGVPTIGYRIPGLVDSISDNYSGKLVPLGDVFSFVDEIISLIKDPIKLDEISVNARNYVVDNFDADIVNQEIFNFYING
jgi:glycosyltransferase involved in cell wall biosynthesis